MPASDKIALFIDGANFNATAKTLGFNVDFKRLLKEFQSRGTLLRAFYYTRRREPAGSPFPVRTHPRRKALSRVAWSARSCAPASIAVSGMTAISAPPERIHPLKA